MVKRRDTSFLGSSTPSLNLMTNCAEDSQNARQKFYYPKQVPEEDGARIIQQIYKNRKTRESTRAFCCPFLLSSPRDSALDFHLANAGLNIFKSLVDILKCLIVEEGAWMVVVTPFVYA